MTNALMTTNNEQQTTNHSESLARILPLLRCPDDGGSLTKDGDSLVCGTCDGRTPLIDGRIPNFIAAEDSGKLEYEGLSYLTRRDRSAFWRSVYRWIPRPQLVLVRRRENAMVGDFTGRMSRDGGLVLNVGSGNKDYGPGVINMDIAPGEFIDVIATGERLPFAPEIFTGVMSLAVLEHVFDFDRVCREMDRVLKSGGGAFHVIPFMQPAHGVPRDYRRFTVNGFAQMFPGYDPVRTGVISGPGSAAAWIMREYLALLTSFGSKFLYNAGMYVWGWLMYPLKWTDYWLTGSRMAAQLASGVYFEGRKKAK